MISEVLIHEWKSRKTRNWSLELINWREGRSLPEGVLLNGARSEVDDPLSPLHPLSKRTQYTLPLFPRDTRVVPLILPVASIFRAPTWPDLWKPLPSYTWHRRRPGLAYSEKSSFSANSALTGRLKGPLERGSAQLKANLPECDGSGRAWSIGRPKGTSYPFSRLSGRPRGSASRWLADDKFIATANQDPSRKNGRDKRREYRGSSCISFFLFLGGELENLLGRGWFEGDILREIRRSLIKKEKIRC